MWGVAAERFYPPGHDTKERRIQALVFDQQSVGSCPGRGTCVREQDT